METEHPHIIHEKAIRRVADEWLDDGEDLAHLQALGRQIVHQSDRLMQAQRAERRLVCGG